MKERGPGRSRTAADRRYQSRLNKRWDELKWLYCELYGQRADTEQRLQELTEAMRQFYDTRSKPLKETDRKREADPRLVPPQ